MRTVLARLKVNLTRHRLPLSLLALALIAAVAMLVSPGASDFGRTFVVAPDGSDNAAGTEIQPYRTIAHALQQLRAGDTLYIRGGEYRERIRGLPIAPAQPPPGPGGAENA